VPHCAPLHVQDMQHLGVLDALLRSEADPAGRQLLLTVIRMSSPELKQAMVGGQTISLLGAWVTGVVSGRRGVGGGGWVVGGG